MKLIPAQALASHFCVSEQTALEVDVPHLHALLRHVGLFEVDEQASTDSEHLQTPFPLFAVISQYAPVDIPVQVAKDAVHLHFGISAFVASQ